MESQWQNYSSDPTAHRQTRYPANAQAQQHHLNGSAHQQQPNPGQFGYDAYQAPAIPSQNQSMTNSPTTAQHRRRISGDGDVAMEDADPYNKMKYPSRPSHQQKSSGQFLNQQGVPSGSRYSPVKALSPSSPYTPSSAQATQNPYGPFSSHNTSARQSPTRASHLSTPSQSNYTSAGEFDVVTSDETISFLYNVQVSARQGPLNLPPLQLSNASPDQYYPNSANSHLNAVFGREARSPRTAGNVRTAPDRGPVPKFRKINPGRDLEPRVNPQPAFRRANPEGGFISVKWTLSEDNKRC